MWNKSKYSKRLDDKGVDTEKVNAILGEPDKKRLNSATNNYAFDAADESEQQEMSIQDDKEDSRSIDIIDSRR
jgi:hypothetical protein